MEDFFKFKADVYQYLDGKTETLNNTYSTKFNTLFEFIDRADEKLRALIDQKDKNEFSIESFKTKFNQKLSIAENNLKDCLGKSSSIDEKMKDHQTFIMKLKKAV